MHSLEELLLEGNRDHIDVQGMKYSMADQRMMVLWIVSISVSLHISQAIEVFVTRCYRNALFAATFEGTKACKGVARLDQNGEHRSEHMLRIHVCVSKLEFISGAFYPEVIQHVTPLS